MTSWRKFPWIRSTVIVVVAIGLTFGITYIFADRLFSIGSLSVALKPDPGIYEVASLSRDGDLLNLWLVPQDSNEPASYYVLPARIVHFSKRLFKPDLLIIVRESGWTGVTLYLGP